MTRRQRRNCDSRKDGSRLLPDAGGHTHLRERMARKYSSTRSGAARKVAAALLPCPCFRCGRIVTADMRWNADHTISRVEAEAMGIPQHEQDRMVAPSHAHCDASHGAKLGNQLRGRRTPEQRTIPRVERPQLGFFGEDQQSPEGAPQNPSLINPEGAL